MPNQLLLHRLPLIASVGLIFGAAIAVGVVTAPPTPDLSASWSEPCVRTVAVAEEVDVREGQVIVDLGDWQPSTEANGVIRLRNHSKSDLVVADVTTNCGCTTAELTSRVVPAGGTLAMPITLTASSIIGRERSKEITITFEQKHPALTINLRCRTREYVTIEPARILLNDERDGTEPCVEIASVSDEPFRITAIEPAVFAQSTMDASTRHELTLRQSGDGSGNFPRFVKVHLDHPRAPVVTIELIQRDR